MSATTTQLLSSGEFCKLRYDTVPVKSASANVSFYTKSSKMQEFWSCDTLVANERYISQQSLCEIRTPATYFDIFVCLIRQFRTKTHF